MVFAMDIVQLPGVIQQFPDLSLSLLRIDKWHCDQSFNPQCSVRQSYKTVVTRKEMKVGEFVNSTLHSDYSATSEGACWLEQKSTVCGTQTAGHFRVKAADKKAMIDFF